MPTFLVTGATSFLGYHVVKRLNEQGIRPRVLEWPGSSRHVLDTLEVERCAGDLGDVTSMRAACSGVDTLLHMAFTVSIGGGAALVDEMRRVNVAGTQQLLDTAAAAGVSRAVVAGSALGVGVNRAAVPLDESADPTQHAFDLPYANIRREAELAALARATPTFSVVSVCPSFTFGPDDPTGAPGNTLLAAIASRKVRFTLRVGFGCLDVRDFAAGAMAAAQSGRSGERYLLSGDNTTATQLGEHVAAIAAIPAPRLTIPAPVVRVAVAGLELFSRLRGTPAPITRDVVQIVGRYAWYDTTKARREFGWTTRPLDQTLRDTLAWLQSHRAGATTARRAAV